MPAFYHYRNSRQARDSSPSSLSVSSALTAQNSNNTSTSNNNTTTTSNTASGTVFATSRPRIYPREYNIRNQRSSHLSNAISPLSSALQNPSELLGRSIPFSSFRSGSSPSSGAPNSLGSASGGVGLSGGPSPPPSAPASYSSGGGGFSASRQVRAYPGFEEQYYGTAGGNNNNNYFYAPSQRPTGVPLNGPAHLQAGENNYACELATVDELGLSSGNPRVAGGSGGSGGGDNVVCLGWDGGVDIWRIGRGAVEQVGRLEGLRGSVKGAKILPNPPLNDPLSAHRPLICLTVHSPIIQGPGSDADHEAAAPLSESPYSSSPPSRPETSNSHRSSQNGDTVTDWQTTVEVWSLSMKTRLCILFTSPSIPTADLGFGNFAPPPVWGNLRVQVTGDKIVVGVGTSGEVYVFGVEGDLNGGGLNGGDGGAKRGGGPDQERTGWKCLEKVWTSVQFPHGQGVLVDGVMGLGLGSLGFPSIGTPVFSLSGRWLAYCPVSSGALTAGGQVGVPTTSPSVVATAPPPQPAISAACALEDEAFLNRMAREVTQEVIRGAKWAADAGFKKFQSYMNSGAAGGNSPPLPHQIPGGMGMTQPNGMQIAQIGNVQQPSGLGQQIRQLQQMGGSPQQSQQQPTQVQAQYGHEQRLVSIIDLHKPSKQESGLPMATFLPPAGVSFLSFAPGGLLLLTASSKGDVLFVWDLLKVVHHPPGSLNNHQRSVSGASDANGGAPSPDTAGRHVRQIARFTRMTVATIVDVDWSSPRGEKIAVVTEKGTAHFYDLPYAALQWPPPRRPPPSSAVANGQTTAAGAVVSNAVDLFNSSTRPLLTAARRRRSRSSSVGSPGGGMFGSPSVGRRTFGALGTSPNDPPAGGNKIPLPPSTSGVAPGCVKFLTAKERGYVAVIGGGLLRIYELRPGGSGKKDSKTGGVASGNWWEYDLPNVPVAPEHTFAEPSDGKTSGYWVFRSHWGRSTDEDSNTEGFWKTPLAWAEIETNSAFIPWHQERRVKMFVYEPDSYHKQIRPPEIKFLASSLHSPSTFAQLSSSPLSWEADFTARRAKKGKKSKMRASPSPSLEPSESASLTPSSEVLAVVTADEPLSTIELPQAPKEKWVFGMPMRAERIFLSDAGGRGDVAFCGEGELGLETAMMDKLQLDVATGGSEEGFFEEDVEMLSFA